MRKDRGSQPYDGSACASQPQEVMMTNEPPILAESAGIVERTAVQAAPSEPGRSHSSATISDLRSREEYKIGSKPLQGNSIEDLKVGQAESNRQLEKLGEIMINATRVLVAMQNTLIRVSIYSNTYLQRQFELSQSTGDRHHSLISGRSVRIKPWTDMNL